MEVHHHPDLHHRKKRFKEYFLEFLMIFLAVMMGFFAESYREHISENQKAKEFSKTLYSDLKADTATLNKYLIRINFFSSKIDTLMQLLSSADPKDIPSGKLYWYGLFGGGQLAFLPHDATLLEMKNSGSLRFFNKPSLNRMIAEYDQKLQTFKLIEGNEQGIYTEVRKLRAQLFNFKFNEAANTVVQHYYKMHTKEGIDSFINSNPPLLSDNKVLFNEYIELVRSRFLKNRVIMADTLNHHAIRLLTALKKEYNLEDE